MRRAGGAIALGLALCLVAGAFAAPPLYVPGVALLLIAGAAIAWVWLASRGAGVAREIDRISLAEGAPLRVAVRVTRSRVPLPGAELHAWNGGVELALPRAGGSRVTVTTRFARRGRHRLAPASLVVSDPLGLCRRTILSADDEVLVLPRVEPVELAALHGGTAAGGPGAAGEASAGATDVDSLQPHRPGSPASRIHWPTVARTMTLMERRLVAERDRLPLVVVDSREPASLEALDQAVRAAASLCVHLARRGGCAVLLPGDRRPAQIDGELFGFAEVHARLALLAPGAGVPSGALVAGAATVLWVTAAPARASLPAPARYLVSPHPHPRWPVRFTVAGCRGYALEATGVGSVAV